MMIKKIKWLFLASLVLASCSSDDDNNGGNAEVPITSGDADFSTYVALGNSLTAGFTDGALFIRGQENAFTKLMADQFELAGGGEFRVPYMSDNVGGLLLGGTMIQGPRLIFNGAAPVPLPGGQPTTDITSPLNGLYNNMGIPGAKSFHLLAPGYGNIAGVMTGQANPYFVRFASSASTTVLEDAMAQSPTFFSLWIGNNDVLGYATSGGDGTNPITDETMFATAYNTLITTLTSNGAKGVVANIPNVTTIPHFTTVPYNPLSPSNPSFGPQIPLLNQMFGMINQAYQFLGVPERSVVYSETENSPVLIHDETLTNIASQLAQVLQAGGLDAPTAGLLANQFGQSRQATPADLFVLPVSSIIGTLNQQYFSALVAQGVSPEQAGQLAINGVTYPLQDQWVLLPSEQQEIITATNAFNAIIKSAAEQKGLAFVDVNALLVQLANGGIRFDNFHMTASFVQGGAFSLDGIHLSARANAYIANKFMEAINATYGSTLRMYKPQDFPVHYPISLN